MSEPIGKVVLCEHGEMINDLMRCEVCDALEMDASLIIWDRFRQLEAELKEAEERIAKLEQGIEYTLIELQEGIYPEKRLSDLKEKSE